MRYYAVAYYNFGGEGELQIKITKALSWRDALQRAFGAAQYLPTAIKLETAKQIATDQDWMFDVVEISVHRNTTLQ